jgi:hypothetical protein
MPQPLSWLILFSYSALNIAARSGGLKLRFSGTVVGVKPSFVFIRPEDGPTVLSSTTMVGNDLLQRGTKVTFNLTFSAKGPFAERVEIVK